MFGEIKSYSQGQIMQDLSSRAASNDLFANFGIFSTSTSEKGSVRSMEKAHRDGWCFGVCLQLLSKIESFVQRGGNTDEESYTKAFCTYIDCLMSVGSLKLQSLQSAFKNNAGQDAMRAIWGFHWRKKPGLLWRVTGAKEEEHGHAIIVDFTIKNLALIFDPNFGLFGFNWHGTEPKGPAIVENFAKFKKYCARENICRINVYMTGEDAVIGAIAASRV